MTKIRLQVGDAVLVRKGKDKGKSGKVTAVQPATNKVTVEGVNVVKKNQKPDRRNPQGGQVELTKPLPVANVGIAHPTDKKKTSRVGYEVSKDGSKKRVYVQANRKEIK